jgi:ferredoxin
VRIVVNRMLCESNAVCVGVAPEVFELSDDDELLVLDPRPSEAERPNVEAAVRLCPKQALSIEEDE